MKTRDETNDVEARDDLGDPDDYRERAIELIYRLPIGDVITLAQAISDRVRAFESLQQALYLYDPESPDRSGAKKNSNRRPAIRAQGLPGSHV